MKIIVIFYWLRSNDEEKVLYMSSTDTILVIVLDAEMKMRAGDACGVFQ